MKTTKVCSKCKVAKPLIEFQKMSTGKDGLRPNCKLCSKKYYEANAERCKQYSKVYRKANAIARKAYQYEYDKSHKFEKLARDYLKNVNYTSELEAIYNSQQQLCYYTLTPIDITQPRGATLEHLRARSTHEHLSKDIKNLVFINDKINVMKNNLSIERMYEIAEKILDREHIINNIVINIQSRDEYEYQDYLRILAEGKQGGRNRLYKQANKNIERCITGLYEFQQGQCYLTGEIIPLKKIQIDHIISRKDQPELSNVFTNVLLTSPDANRFKYDNTLPELYNWCRLLLANKDRVLADIKQRGI